MSEQTASTSRLPAADPDVQPPAFDAIVRLAVVAHYHETLLRVVTEQASSAEPAQ